MNGFNWKGLAFGSILAFPLPAVVDAEESTVTPNELACERDRQACPVTSLDCQIPKLDVQLASHKCDGDRCYVIDDQATTADAKEGAGSVPHSTSSESEAIVQSDSAPPMLSSPLGRSLGGFSRPPQAAVEKPIQLNVESDLTMLRVQNADLLARWEMTQTIFQMQNHYIEQLRALERENARLVAESTEFRVKNEVNEQLTAGLIERTELAAKLTAAHDWISSRSAYEGSIPIQSALSEQGLSPSYQEAIAAIQEDISNIRRQIPLIKRAPSSDAPDIQSREASAKVPDAR
ncbi:MAG: hypothetical protein SGI77_07585 [Pirellulaceae bacterium]|nr:hypothetical protein [Pirellulaceae bacterium]